MEFLWNAGLEPPSFPPLNGDRDVDILVIGGGMAGVLCAYLLEQAGADYILVEAERIGQGITKGTTAVLSAQHGTLYQDMIEKSGRETARLYLRANCEAVEDFRRLAAQIPCDFEDAPSVLYDKRNRARMKREAAAIQSLGFPAEFLTTTPLPHRVAGAVLFPGMAQFHPLKFLYGVAAGLRIFENTFVEKLDGTTATTARGVIRAKRVIVTTHFPFVNRHGMYFMKLYQKRSYVIALENAPKLDCTLDDYAASGIYLRSYGNLLLIGGGDHRTGTKSQGFAVPRDYARRYFPEAREVYAWANQDCISLDGIPYIGPYSLHFPKVYVATGFNEWGMSSSMVAAKRLTGLVLGRPSPYAPVFAPDRSMLHKQLFLNLGETLINFIRPTPRRCPHMGCALHWNKAEHTWDCPCHGSRFDKDGTLIDNPAMKDIHT